MKIFSTFFICLMMCSHLVAQAVAINNRAGVGTGTSVSTMTISSFQVPANNNRLLVTCAVNTVNQNAPAVTFNGTTMNQIVTDVQGGLRTTMYYLVLGSNASATTANIVATGTNITNLGAISFHNVNQSTPYNSLSKNAIFATNTDVIPASSSVSMANTSNDVVCDCISVNANGVTGIATNTGQTQEVVTTKTNSPVVYMGISSKSGTGSNINLGWSLNTTTSLGTGQFVHHGITVLSVNTTVPIELTYFKGQTTKDNNIQLLWQTISEQNNAGFTIQRSNDGKKWQDLTFVKGKMYSSLTNNYNWEDTEAMSGFNYYRLKQMDTDGQFSFSPVVLMIVGKNNKFSVFPNPTKDELYYQSDNLSSIKRIQLYDATGKLLQETTHINGKLSIERLSAGLYGLMIYTDAGNYYERIVKQ